MFHTLQTSNMGSSTQQIKNNTFFVFKGWFNIKTNTHDEETNSKQEPNLKWLKTKHGEGQQ